MKRSAPVRRTAVAGRFAAVLLLMVFAGGPAVPAKADEPVDLEVVHRIKDEAFLHSQVMEHLFALTDANGPRLTGSPGFKSAADWAVGRLRGWGLADARLESWGKFGHGWEVVHVSAALVSPVHTPLRAIPKAWCAGTGGPVEGEVVAAPLYAETDEDAIRYDLKRYAAQVDQFSAEQKGRLRGKVVMIDPVRALALPADSPVERYSDAKLLEIAAARDPRPIPAFTLPLERMPADRKDREALSAALPAEATSDFFAARLKITNRLNAFLRDEGVLAVLASDVRGSGGTIFVQGSGGWDLDTPPAPPTLVLAPEDYNRIARLLDHGMKPRVAVNLETRSDDSSPDGFNVVAEMPGTSKRGEVVMLGAHLDSWHGGTGATDNAAGCAVVLEALRILKTLGLSPQRTVRLALWGGEEEGLLGSRGYVRKHFGDPVTMALTPEHARLSGYFNLDNGTGKIRGVYLQGNDAMRPLFQSWLLPFKDLGVTTITARDTGGTDHKSFDAVGLPGFQFIQDPIDYETRTHHSDMDVYDRIQAGDLMQAAAVLASCVYDAAARPAMLPRKPLPTPSPAKKPN